MTSPDWTPRPDGRSGADNEGSGLVRWRRRGSAAELRFAEPAGSKTWRRRWLPTALMPWASAVGWWFTGAAAHVAATAGFVFGFAAGGLELAPVWIGSIIGLVVPPAAGVVGFVRGRGRQIEAERQTLAIEGIDRAAEEALGGQMRGFGGKALSQKVADAMRSGAPQRARLLSKGGYLEYRIEPVDATTVSIVPLEPGPDAQTFNRLVRTASAPLTGSGNGVTAATDRRIRALEDRLDAIERIGGIDAGHPSYPRFVILQIDRLTEYRQLAGRAESISRVDSEEARRTTHELVRDLEHIVDLVSVGVDELEREVLAESKRSSDAHLGFLRDKYAG